MIYQTQLNNGLTIIVDYDDNAKTVTCEYVVAAGSIDEHGTYDGENNFGVAHFTEHMLFKGTLNRSVEDINNDIAAIGGVTNAATSFDRTIYYISSPADVWKDNLEILNDIFWNSTIPEDEFNQEKQVILEELTMYMDQPRSCCMENLDILANPNDENRQRVAGTLESVQNLTSDDIKRFMKCFYQPGNVALIVSGNVPIDELVADVDFFMLHMTEQIIPSKEMEYKNELLNNNIIKMKNASIKQAHLAFMIKGALPSEKDFYTLDLLSDILGGGFTSRLYNIIREKLGLAYTVKVSLNIIRDASYMIGYCGLQKSNIDNVHSIIVKELNKLRKELIPDTELNTMKALYKGKLLLSAESTSSKIDLHEDNFIYGTNDTTDTIINCIMNITPKDMQICANKYFTKNNICWSVVEPA